MSRTMVGDPLVGRLLDGRYQITERLARGGMATVYRAVDTRLTRTVAVKVMHVGLGDDAEFARKFDREARAAARLAHPNVVGVFDQGADLVEGHGSRPYIVMEHVDGHTLRDVIVREAPLPPLRALEVMEPVLAALAAAHDAGLVHRDVKPENVLISDRGQLKVADFGLAKAISSQTSTATQGLLIGTVSYLPPELVVSGRADARSDVYSAGVVLFELLTGRKPHTGDTPIQVAYAHVHNDVPAPSAFPTDEPVPGYVDALVARATARSAGARPTDARVLLGEVRRVQAALREGVRADPELERELRDAASPVAPSRRRASDYEVTQLVPVSLPSPPTVVEAPPPVPLPRPVPAQAPAPARPYAGAGSRRRRRVHRRRRGVVALLLVLLLTTGVAAAGWYAVEGRFTSTPALATLGREEAARVAERAGVLVAFTEAFSETVPPGAVIGTEPGPGSRIVRGGEVAATVSRGPERFTVPEVVGLSRAEAESALERGSLRPGEITGRFSEKVAAGTVLAASPEAGVKRKGGTAVDLVVSKGPAPIPVRSFVGRSAGPAAAALREAGFRVVVERRHSDAVAKGLVLAQDPNGGQGRRGDTVTLTESKGPVLVVVPNVRRMPVKAAQRVMADAGFRTRIQAVSVNFLDLGYVVYTDPGTRTKAPRGATITLHVV